MNEYKKMKMSEDYTLSVQSSALFSDIQHFLDKQGLYKEQLKQTYQRFEFFSLKQL